MDLDFTHFCNIALLQVLSRGLAAPAGVGCRSFPRPSSPVLKHLSASQKPFICRSTALYNQYPTDEGLTVDIFNPNPLKLLIFPL